MSRAQARRIDSVSFSVVSDPVGRSLVSRRERALEPGLRRECSGPLLGLGGLARGFAQRSLKSDAEMPGHAALLLLAE